MEIIVSLGFNGENPSRIQCNLDKPQNIIPVNGNATTLKLSINYWGGQKSPTLVTIITTRKITIIFFLSNKLIKGQINKGLMFETWAFQIFHGGNSTFINWFDKTNFHVSLSHWCSTTVSLENEKKLHFYWATWSICKMRVYLRETTGELFLLCCID